MNPVVFPSGVSVPQLGQGTWMMGQGKHSKADEIAALRLGLDHGLTLIDTAEMYGDGAAERVVGEAIGGRRDEVVLVSKVLPSHAGRRALVAACEASLKRLNVERIDLYLLHWPGSTPLTETIGAFTSLVEQGKIGGWGVSNFDAEDMAQAYRLSSAVQTNQVLYNLTRRGIEFDLLPWCRERAIPVIAYSPLEQGRLLGHRALAEMAARHVATQAQIALAWVLAQQGMIAIPKAGSLAHVRENIGALSVRLSAEDMAILDQAFPPPRARRPLEVL